MLVAVRVDAAVSWPAACTAASLLCGASSKRTVERVECGRFFLKKEKEEEKNKSTCDWHVLCCAVLRLLVLQRPGLLRAHTPNITTLHRTLPSQPQHPIVAAPVHAAVTWACCVHSCWRRWKHPTKLNARPLQRWVAGQHSTASSLQSQLQR